MKASNLDTVNLKKLNLERSPFTEISVFVTKIKYPHFGGSVKLIKLTQPEPTIILWKEEKRTEVTCWF